MIQLNLKQQNLKKNKYVSYSKKQLNQITPRQAQLNNQTDTEREINELI